MVWFVLMALAVVVFVYLYGSVVYLWMTHYHGFGQDTAHYFAGVKRFLETGSPYEAFQLAGPYDFETLPFIHPPVALYLFAPFAYLPAVLWWAIPIIGTSVLLVAMRPARWTWPLIVGLLCWYTMPKAVIWGNSDMWMLFAVTAGLWFGWPALAIVAKPSMLPFMFVGVRHRSWWVGLAVVLALSVPFGMLWLDWVRVVFNSPGTLAYSLAAMIPLLAPVIAWWTRDQLTESVVDEQRQGFRDVLHGMVALRLGHRGELGRGRASDRNDVDSVGREVTGEGSAVEAEIGKANQRSI